MSRIFKDEQIHYRVSISKQMGGLSRHLSLKYILDAKTRLLSKSSAGLVSTPEIKLIWELVMGLKNVTSLEISF